VGTAPPGGAVSEVQQAVSVVQVQLGGSGSEEATAKPPAVEFVRVVEPTATLSFGGWQVTGEGCVATSLGVETGCRRRLLTWLHEIVGSGVDGMSSRMFISLHVSAHGRYCTLYGVACTLGGWLGAGFFLIGEFARFGELG
jgi:hypothetical protein